jgi:hypothetical protein
MTCDRSSFFKVIFEAIFEGTADFDTDCPPVLC